MNLRNNLLLKLPLFFLFASFIWLGSAMHISAQKVKLRSQITPNCTQVRSTAGWKFADIYADGNIAVQGSYGCNGAFIYDISNPDAPALSAWYNPGNNQQFLEAIVIGNRGYFGSGNGGGVHIVDLSSPASPQLLGIVNSTNGNGHNSIHEMMVINQNGQDFLIENFNGFSSKIIKIINVTNPASPVFVRDLNPTEAVWVHAMHVRGNKMYTSGWGSSTNRGRTEIYDISNLATQAPTLLGFISDSSPTITNGNNMHSSWTSEDGNYLYSCRETANGQGDVRTYDVTNPAQPMLVNRVTMTDLNLNAVTPHNPVVLGNKLYVAWYQAGLQVFDITTQSSPKRIGQYDTFQPQFVEEESPSLFDEPWDMVCGSSSLQNALPTNYNGNWAVFPLLGEDKVLAGDMTHGLLILDVRNSTAPSKNVVSDFDGDRKTDFSVFTSNNGTWNIEASSNGAFSSTTFGASQDKIVSGDYDGDNKTDHAVFRPSAGTWYILGSTSGFRAVAWGAGSDIPVAADFDADGKTDVAVFRPSNGVWYILQSTLGFKAIQWGQNGDKPLIGDFEGDGKADLTVYYNGVWYILQSSSSIPMYVSFGNSTDKPISGDFDGDGKTDITVYRPSEGYWYTLNSNNNSLSVAGFGLADDLPIPADYDGDGKTDISVYRPSLNAWYRLNSSDGSFASKIFGQTGDNPSPTSAQPQ